ncbi:hypothetical protein DL93DRAFT_2091635 [Clavulina sp. PMI_390]|nr:hypothetical protein DL93DRAFT_2091635 [Clavulina sp. PMI_390]
MTVKHRYRCKTCGANIASWHESKQKWSVWTATFDRKETEGQDGPPGTQISGWEWAKPTDHQFYDTRMLDINDGLPKWEGYAEASRRIE